jgi:signal transduction histidine kinase
MAAPSFVTAWWFRYRRRFEVELVLALVVSAAAFLLAALVSTAARSHVPALLLGLFFVAGILAVAKLGGVIYAVPVGLVTLEAFDWYFLPPYRDLDLETAFVLGVSIVTSVLVAEIASRAGRRADVSEEARGLLAEEQAALRRVATLVARGLPPTEVFAVVAEEIGRLLSIDGTRVISSESDGAAVVALFRFGPDGTATVIATSSELAATVGRSWSFPSDDPSVLASLLRTGRPERIDDYAEVGGVGAEIASEIGVGSAVGVPVIVGGRTWGAVTVGLVHGRPPLPADTFDRLTAFTDLVATAIANAVARTEIEQLAEEQAALRRVATLVAEGVAPAKVFSAVSEEVSLLVDAEAAVIGRLEADGRVTVVAVSGTAGDQSVLDTQFDPEPESVLAAVIKVGRSTRKDDYSEASESPRRLGIRSGVGAPIVVEGALWGVVAIGTVRERLPDDTEQRLEKFTALAATAIANAESRSELAASRARVVAASDETRRQIERDLHDGTQQRLVSLGLALRAAEAKVPPELGVLRAELDRTATGLADAVEDLQEISRGIHPAILSRGGLAPALETLAGRSAVAVELKTRIDCILPESVEAAAYYIVSEALTNAAKHARASLVQVELATEDSIVELAVRDDGVGGADPAGGSGLIGLRDRVEALGGTMEIASSAGRGTSLMARIPTEGIDSSLYRRAVRSSNSSSPTSR